MHPQDFPKHLITKKNRQAGEFLRELACGDLDVLIVLGSGLAETLEESDKWDEPIASVELSAIPGVVSPVADGHVDHLRIYKRKMSEHKSLNVAVAFGRTHLYEGLGPEPTTALARSAAAAGVKTAILCNANGCLREWNLGDVMTITDHANLTGVSPFNGPFFMDITNCWDKDLAKELSAVTERQGSYAFLRGPEYQTTLETQMMAACGIDAVGMSTVLEALMLHALGVKVCGMSVVSDLSFAEAPTDPSVVVDMAKRAQITLGAGIETVLETVARNQI